MSISQPYKRANIIKRICVLGVIVLLLLVSSCAFLKTRGAGPAGSLALQVEFDSEFASARLTWDPARVNDFRRYRLERGHTDAFDPAAFEVIAEITDQRHTNFVDERITAARQYSYRVVALYGLGKNGEREGSLTSAIVTGSIHAFAELWSMPAGFLPTRIIVDQDVVSVLGAGAGYVARFDLAGNELGRWRFTSGLNACLETATLDAPSAATAPDGSLYVVHNVFEEGAPPLPRWTKFDATGKLLWTHPLESVFARHIFMDDEHIFIESVSQLQQFDHQGVLQQRYPVPPLMVSRLRLWPGSPGSLAALVEPLGLDTSGWQAPRLVVYAGFDRQRPQLVMGRDPLSEDDHGAGLLRRPSDFVVTAGGERVFVVNAGNDRIEVFRDGRFLTRWGRQGDGEGGQFRFSGKVWVIDDLSSGSRHQRNVVAGGIARDRHGYIYVADTFNNRIQKFRP